jgi:formate dehydrogenase maturation protein FdhE
LYRTVFQELLNAVQAKAKEIFLMKISNIKTMEEATAIIEELKEAPLYRTVFQELLNAVQAKVKDNALSK